MILLLSKTCQACWRLDGIEKVYKNIQKYYVEDGWVKVDGLIVHLDPKISMLPCLIDENKYIMMVDTILAYLKKSGELNATANIL